MSWSAERFASNRAVWAVAGLCLLAGAAFAVVGRSSDVATLTGGPYYFETAEIATGGNRVPITPKGKIAATEAKKRTVYGVAMFDDQGRLASYEMVKDGRRHWHSKLAYSASGVLESETYTGPKGSVVLWRFDPSGFLVDSRMIKGPDESIE